MTDRRAFLTASMAGLAASVLSTRNASGASAPPTARQIAQKDMAAVNLDGWQVTISEVSYAPGEGSNRHRHPGFVCGYVLEGQYEFGVDGQPSTVLSAGQTFFEEPGDVHAVSRNPSSTMPAKILAMVFTPKNGPVTIPG